MANIFTHFFNYISWWAVPTILTIVILINFFRARATDVKTKGRNFIHEEIGESFHLLLLFICIMIVWAACFAVKIIIL